MLGKPALRIVLGVVALGVAAGGMWTAASGSGGSRTPSDAPAPAAVTPSASPTAGSTPTPLPPPTATATTAATETAAPAAAQPPAATSALPKVAVAAPTAAATATPTQDPRDQPVFTANAVLDLSRSVRLPNGETFELCSALGLEGEPWPFAVHLYWAGRNTWVIETHRGDAGLYFDEATATFRVKVVERAGC